MSNNIHQTSGRGKAIIIFTDQTHIQVHYTRHPGTRGTHTITISDSKKLMPIQNKTIKEFTSTTENFTIPQHKIAIAHENISTQAKITTTLRYIEP